MRTDRRTAAGAARGAGWGCAAGAGRPGGLDWLRAAGGGTRGDGLPGQPRSWPLRSAAGSDSPAQVCRGIPHFGGPPRLNLGGVSWGGARASGSPAGASSLALSPARAPGAGEGGRFWPVPPPHAPPRGPDSGVRGRTGDARPVYPPGAASAPTGGAARAGEGSPPRPATCPGRSALGRKTPSPPRWYPRVQAPSTLGLTSPGLQCLVPQTHQSRLSPPPSLPQGVCCLVLVALSLWPDIAAAPGPPPGPPRASADPRAELDSAVLLSRSLLADTRQLAAQLVGETGGNGREPGPGVTEWVSGLPPWQRGGGRNLRLVGGGVWTTQN